MKEAHETVSKLRQRKIKGEFLQNYQEIKSNLYWDFIRQSPGPNNVLVNIRLLERAVKFCKLLLKNEHSESNMNDLVKNELKPKDFGYCKAYDQPYANGGQPTTASTSITRMYNEKHWQQLLAYSKLDLPVSDFAHLPCDLAPGKRDLKTLQAMISRAGETHNTSQQEQIKAERIAHNAGWEKPSLYLMYRVAKCHLQMKKAMP